MHKILNLVSNPEIKWTKSRSRLEARDWRKQNLDLVSKVKLGISSMSVSYQEYMKWPVLLSGSAYIIWLHNIYCDDGDNDRLNNTATMDVVP